MRKKILTTILAVVMLVSLLPLTAQGTNVLSGFCGADVDGKNLTWTLNKDTGELVISGTGSMKDYELESGRTAWTAPDSEAPWITNENGQFVLTVHIQSGVTNIGENAFCGCYNLEEVYLGKDVAAFPPFNGPFYDCPVKSITVDADNPSLKSVDGVLYNKAQTKLICYPPAKEGTRFQIPSGVTEIDSSAFPDYFYLNCIVLPEGITTIKEWTFEPDPFGETDVLKEIHLPHSLTVIEENAFSFNDALRDIYYAGSKEDWSKIKIGKSDSMNNETGEFEDLFTLATIHFASGPVTTDGEKVVSFTLEPGVPGSTGVAYDYSFDYSDSLFNENSYSLKLAQLSLGLANAAFANNKKDDAEGENWKSKNIRKAFEEMGFGQDYSTDVASYIPEPTKDSIAYAISAKNFNDGTPLVVVAVRGGGYGAEWLGNFTVGNVVTVDNYVFHRNFFDSAMQVLSGVNTYLDKNSIDSNKAKIWIVGFSRGAAVANVTSHFLSDKTINASTKKYSFSNLGFSESNIFAYTYATPSTVANSDKNGATAFGADTGKPFSGTNESIFNHVGYSDFVPMIMPEAWGLGKFGTTYVLPNKTTSSESIKQYQNQVASMQTVYNSIMSDSKRSGSDWKYYDNDKRKVTIDCVLELLSELIPTSTVYASDYQQYLIQAIDNTSDLLYHHYGRTNNILKALLNTSIPKAPFFKVVLQRIEDSGLIQKLDAGEREAIKDLITKAALGKLNINTQLFDAQNTDASVKRIIEQVVNDNCSDSYVVSVNTSLSTLPGLVTIDKKQLADDLYQAIFASLHIETLSGIEPDIIKEHFPEVYLAWMMSYKEGTTPSVYRAPKIVGIRCPVDVYVYDNTNNQLLSIVDDIVTKDGLIASVNSFGEKTIYLPYDKDFSIRIVPSESGTMNLSISEPSLEGSALSQVTYSDLPIAVNSDYKWEIESGLKIDETLSTNGRQVDRDSETGYDHLCAAQQFSDVDINKWYHEGIDYAVITGMMNGVGDGLFNPDGTTTRGMIVTILHRLEGEPTAKASAFRDVQSGSWYENAVNWASQNGIVTGTSSSTFAPNTPVTREQLATILYRYAQYKQYDSNGKADLSMFKDSSSVSSYAMDGVSWAVNAGLINGVGDNMLSPSGSATRAQVATILMRFSESIARGY